MAGEDGNKTANCTTLNFNQWRGLHNRGAQVRLNPEWLRTADNVDIDDSGGVKRKRGLTLFQEQVFDIYRSNDHRRAWLVTDTGQLQAMNALGTDLHTVGATQPLHWTDAGNVTLVHGENPAMILPEQVLPWGLPMAPRVLSITLVPGDLDPGLYRVTVTELDQYGRESGANIGAGTRLVDRAGFEVAKPIGITGRWRLYVTPPDNADYYRVGEYDADTGSVTVNSFVQIQDATVPLKYLLAAPPLDAIDAIGFYDGRVWLGKYDATLAFSRLYGSFPLDFNYFRYDDENTFIDVPGRVQLLAGTLQGLLIVTDIGLHVYSAEGVLSPLAPYGGPAARPAFARDGQVYFMTDRGLARFPPFALLHDEHFAMESAETAVVEVHEHNGYRQVLVVPRGVETHPREPRIDYLTPTVYGE